MKRRLVLAGLASALALTAFGVAAAQAKPVVGVDQKCLKPAGRPAPGSLAWRERDLINM
jgi:hypothetical protein